jgi:hypothetical protein
MTIASPPIQFHFLSYQTWETIHSRPFGACPRVPPSYYSYREPGNFDNETCEIKAVK